MKDGQSKSLVVLLVIIIILLLAIMILFSSKSSINGNAILQNCQKPFILGDNGKCCKDVDENNECDLASLKIYYESSGARKTDENGVYEDFAKVCNGDKYSGKVIAYFGDIRYFNSVEYRTNFDKKYGMTLDFDDKRTMDIISKEGNFREQEVILSPNECYEFSFKNVYVEDSMIAMKIFGEPIIQKGG